MARNKTKKDLQDEADEQNQMYSVFAISALCIIIGLPLWWKTTTTYRANLPYSEIASLAQTKMRYHVPVSVVSCLGVPEVDVNSLQDQLEKNIYWEKNPNSMSQRSTGHLLVILEHGNWNLQIPSYVQYAISVRKCNTNETNTIQKHHPVQELDQSFVDSEYANIGQPIIYLLPGNYRGSHNTHTYVGRYRTAYVSVQRDDLSKSIEHVVTVLKTTLVNEVAMAKVYNSAKGFQHEQADAGTMRALRSAPGYGISFSLLNPQPGILTTKWDIRQAIHDYLEPFTQKLDEFANFIVDSQVLYYTGLSVKPKRSSDKSYYYLSQEQLPLVITPVEAKLGSHVSTYPSLNFLLYVPKRSHSPLYITDSQGEQVPTNAFLSPRWGGVMVYNVPDLTNDTHLPVEISVDMKEAMEVFLSQLRLLIGVPAQSQTASSGIQIEKPSATCITNWEYDVLLRGRTIENIATASATLVSLSQLLDKISNIVINDDIAKQVYQAVKSINLSHSYLQQGDLYWAFHSSKKAIAASEKAFFDPSLLELLYFPDNQKFAIYIPLFLPISLPLLASLFKAIKWLRRRRKEKEA